MGEIAALLTSLCWATSSLFFSISSQKVGSVVVNRMRLLFAVLLLTLTHLITQGQLIPLHASPDRWLWLGLSAVVGLVLGDAFLLQSYVLVGVRIGTLIMSSVPVISALTAWIFLGETLNWMQISGIVLAVSGISFVVLGRESGGSIAKNRRDYLLGIACGLGGALGQALGLILAKKGLYDGFPVLSGVVIRMLVAMIVMWAGALLTGQFRSTLQLVGSQPRILRLIGFGSIAGPFLGVWLSLIAVQNASVGVSSTLMALAPIILLPVMKWGFKEHVSARAVIGTVIALAGVAVILMVPH